MGEVNRLSGPGGTLPPLLDDAAAEIGAPLWQADAVLALLVEHLHGQPPRGDAVNLPAAVEAARVGIAEGLELLAELAERGIPEVDG